MSSRHCPSCRRSVVPRKLPMPTEEHIAHIVASVLFCGLWLIVYALAASKPRGRSKRCPICGTATTAIR